MTTIDAKLNERNEQTINDIKTLQTQEMDLYNDLNNPKITGEQKDQIMKKINQISQMRINLYNSIQQMYSSARNNVTETSNVLEQQVAAIKIIENELNASKRRLNLIDAQKNNKIRLVEINTYYGKQYDFYKNMMKIIVFTCIPIIILSVLGNKGIIPENIKSFLMVIVIVIGCVFFGYQIIDLANRDNMNFDEYDTYFDKAANTNTTGSLDGSEEYNPWAVDMKTCIGAACCDPLFNRYDQAKNVCIPLGAATTTASAPVVASAASAPAVAASIEPMTTGFLTRSFNINKLGGSRNNWKDPRPANAMGLNNFAKI